MKGRRGKRDLSSRNKQIVTVPVLLQFVAGNKSRRIIWSSIRGTNRSRRRKTGEIWENRGRNRVDVVKKTGKKEDN